MCTHDRCISSFNIVSHAKPSLMRIVYTPLRLLKWEFCTGTNIEGGDTSVMGAHWLRFGCWIDRNRRPTIPRLNNFTTVSLATSQVPACTWELIVQQLLGVHHFYPTLPTGLLRSAILSACYLFRFRSHQSHQIWVHKKRVGNSLAEAWNMRYNTLYWSCGGRCCEVVVFKALCWRLLELEDKMTLLALWFAKFSPKWIV